MKKLLLFVVAMLALTTTSVFAADKAASSKTSSENSAPQTQHGDQSTERDWTLDEARKKAHEHAEKMDKMSEAEWAEHQKKRHAFLEKWHSMTPEQKEEYIKNRDEKRRQNMEKQEGSGAGNKPSGAK